MVTKAAVDVLAERLRQVTHEKWTPESDDAYADDQLPLAALCYTYAAVYDHSADDSLPRRYWPWDWSWWKPKDRRSNLVRAAALLIAEIERIDRAAGTLRTSGVDPAAE